MSVIECVLRLFVVLLALGWMLAANADPQRLLPLNAATSHPSFRVDIQPAKRDPFERGPVAVAPPPLPPMEVVAPVEAIPLRSAAPSSPVLVYAGRMRTPEGRWLVMAQMEVGNPVTLEVGKTLGNGYRVERISDHAVELLNPQTQNLMQMAVPAAPRFETW